MTLCNEKLLQQKRPAKLEQSSHLTDQEKRTENYSIRITELLDLVILANRNTFLRIFHDRIA